jgi:hypothetical protein
MNEWILNENVASFINRLAMRTAWPNIQDTTEVEEPSVQGYDEPKRDDGGSLN